MPRTTLQPGRNACLYTVGQMNMSHWRVLLIKEPKWYYLLQQKRDALGDPLGWQWLFPRNIPAGHHEMIDISVMFYAKNPSGVEEEAKRWLKKFIYFDFKWCAVDLLKNKPWKLMLTLKIIRLLWSFLVDRLAHDYVLMWRIYYKGHHT